MYESNAVFASDTREQHTVYDSHVKRSNRHADSFYPPQYPCDALVNPRRHSLPFIELFCLVILFQLGALFGHLLVSVRVEQRCVRTFLTCV